MVVVVTPVQSRVVIEGVNDTYDNGKAEGGRGLPLTWREGRGGGVYA